MRVSFGRLGWRAGGMLVLELTTIGRRSGQLHTVLLTSPVQEGETIVVVAPGRRRPPPRLVSNLRDHPGVQVAFAGKPKRPMQARVATPEERAALWPGVTAAYKGYAEYQTKTARKIPLVLLEPRSHPGAT